MQTEEQREELESISKIETASSFALVNLGNVLAALINQRNWLAIEEMSVVCSDLFEQAAQIEHEEKRKKLQ